MRKNRAEMIRKAREEGVAVDLDELSRIGSEKEKKPRERDEPRSRSFDDIVGSDGMLKSRSVIDEKHGVSTTATETANSNDMRRRGQAHEGFSRGAALANPFADEHGISPEDPPVYQSRSPTATLPVDTPATLAEEPEALIDVHAEPEALTPSASIHSLSTLDDPASQSFHSLAPPSDAPTSPSLHSIGTMTPTSSDGFSAPASVAALSPELAPSHPQILLHHPQPLDLQTPLSLSLHSDAERAERPDDLMSDAGFSMVSAGTGMGGRSTPGEWTDVGSEEGGSEFGDARVQ